MILSIYDYTGFMGQDWEESVIIDIQHMTGKVLNATAYSWNVLERRDEIVQMAKDLHCTFMAAFPPCTDLAVSGAAHFAAKARRNPKFQEEAMALVYAARDIGEALGVPYFIENPVSVISSYWRKPDLIFHPYEFGGYLPEDDTHPQYPDYILPRDAYPKKTCLWVGGGYKLPEKKKVYCAPGYSLQHHLLGGKSLKTKNIRSATPRGFARANFLKYGELK